MTTMMMMMYSGYHGYPGAYSRAHLHCELSCCLGNATVFGAGLEDEEMRVRRSKVAVMSLETFVVLQC